MDILHGQLKTKYNSAKEILEKIKEVEKRKATLQDLESLFKGNKFVEFVAIERLKYVTREASKRLLDITGGEYSMETDDDGIFLIKVCREGELLILHKIITFLVCERITPLR